MKATEITVSSANEHNLKNISLKIPRNAITVITGISGSGKSSLAFDTIYAEGNRRYVESMSSYVRQFVDIIKKPDVENIEGLSPSLAINQKTISNNPRSTVGTITEVYDYLRLLYAKVGEPFCNRCGKPISPKTPDEISNEYCNLKDGTKLTILSPIVRGKKGEYSKLMQKLLGDGFTKIYIDGKKHELENEIKIDKNKAHTIELLVDKIVVNRTCGPRLSESISLAMKLSAGVVKIQKDDKDSYIISDKYSCIDCETSYSDIEPRLFSFNSPYGACPECGGLGVITKEDETSYTCKECNGTRLKKEALSIKIDGKSIHDLSCVGMSNLKDVLLSLKIGGNKEIISNKIIKEITERLDFINNVGLGYLTLSRRSNSLSGGEAQRVRLATQLGSGLTGVIYVLDEPSIGLHPSDNQKLLDSLVKLKTKGNTVIIVEHDEDTIRCADHIIDFGPGAGVYGGKIVAQGNLNDILANNKSLTGLYLSSNIKIQVPKQRKKAEKKFITIKNVSTNNLKNITASFPVGLMTAVTGISGSGKSSLIIDTLCPCLESVLKRNKQHSFSECKIEGTEHIERLVNIDQGPIGQTPRSNPATYTDIFNQIRSLFTQLPDSKVRGYLPGRFSFNVAGGRCNNCEGQGLIKVEMKFMPDVFVTCDACGGAKFNRDTLEIKYKGKSIADVLDMTVEEAMVFFRNIPVLHVKLKTLHDVGLGYIKLGQSSVTLSGGEAQRVKLSKELSKKSSGKTLYVLDEPTTGLHFDDIKKLINVLHKLRDQGNTIIVIEHNLEVIKTSDYIIDLGPDGGEAGGHVIAKGTPEDIVTNKDSKTGFYLKQKL